MEKAENVEKTATVDTPVKTSEVFRVHGILNLVAAIVATVLVACLAFVPMFRIGAPDNEAYEGFDGINEVYLSAFDVITGLSDGGELGEISKDAGNLDKALNLLYLQSMADYESELKEYEAAGKPEGKEPDVPPSDRFMIMFSNVSILVLPLGVIISAIFCLVKLIIAIVRLAAPKPYPKSGGNGAVVWIIPVLVIAFDYIWIFAADLINKGFLYDYIYFGYEMTNFIILFALGFAVTVVDIIASGIAKSISKKHYPK